MGQYKYLPLFKHKIHTFTEFKAAARGLPRASLNIVRVQLLFLAAAKLERELCCCAGSLGELGPVGSVCPAHLDPKHCTKNHPI
jgi:hypothetical protein